MNVKRWALIQATSPRNLSGAIELLVRGDLTREEQQELARRLAPRRGGRPATTKFEELKRLAGVSALSAADRAELTSNPDTRKRMEDKLYRSTRKRKRT